MSGVIEGVDAVDGALLGSSGSILGLPNLNVGSAYRGKQGSILIAETVLFTSTTPGYIFLSAWIESDNDGAIVSVYDTSIAEANLLSRALLDENNPSQLVMNYPGGSPNNIIVTVQSDGTHACYIAYQYWSTSAGSPVDYQVSESAYIYSGAATTNYSGGTYFKFGSVNAAAAYRGLLRFDLSTLPAGSIVTAAEMELTQYETEDTYDAYLAIPSADWAFDEVTWTDRVTGTAWAAAGDGGGSVSPVPIWHGDIEGELGTKHTFDVTTEIADIASGAASNLGFIFYNMPWIGGYDNKFCSYNHATPAYRPKLTITTL